MPGKDNSEVVDMFGPPVNRAMRVLDRSFFRKTIPLTAARVLNNKQISRCRNELSHDLLHLERLTNVRHDGDDPKGRKSLVLRPDIRLDGNPGS